LLHKWSKIEPKQTEFRLFTQASIIEISNHLQQQQPSLNS